jgi:hypothetical protein
VSGPRRASAWIRAAVFALDRRLCRRNGVYEFTDDPQCLFRIQCLRLESAVALADGTRVPAGGRVLALHLWNAHVPPMEPCGPTLAWACRTERALRHSLRQLAGYLASQADLGDIEAICADMRVNGAAQPRQLSRVLGRYGFEAVPGEIDRRGVWHRIGDAIFIAMLVSVTHPPALRNATLRLGNMRLWLSRSVLEQRYAPAGRRRRPLGVESVSC